MIDTQVRVETPEGVELTLSPAGPVPRCLAWLLDALIRWVVYATLSPGFAFLGKTGLGLLFLALFLLEWGYPVAFEVLNGGRTPGKAALGLRVVREDGAPVAWTQSMVRSIVAVVDFLPFAYGTGLVAMFASRRFQRLGDLAAGTYVVHAEPAPVRALPPPAEGEALLEPRLPLTLEEQRAVMDFAERVPALTPARAQELADLLEPLTGARGGEGVARTLALARVLRGGAP
ncbi:RDD family protein [Mesoterricola sediminis]|uniref:RDD family protein n=1 Tax=Mesoterricola sediminis TaxID=2927980 RepID=A0AA48GQ88_9BACT|nr:RDD family protein [Mesoterricola sediminis]BDU77261.1 RDD family protein [Mesoterricola sediminis]